MKTTSPISLLAKLNTYNEHELRRLLIDQLTQQRVGLHWESDAIARDAALNADVVLPRLVEENSFSANTTSHSSNLIIEGDNFDSLRLLRTTHAGKIRVIYIDPPYNTGNNDWLYNDRYVGQSDRWRHSQWLEFLYQRLVIARDLLTHDGVILISINDENRDRLGMLMEEVMPNRRLGSFVWRVRTGGNDTKKALLSENHEHVLVCGRAGFEFRGDGRDESAYSNPDGDLRGDWSNDNLVKAHNAKQRPEAFYSIHNIETDTWYPCDPDSVWRFSSTTMPLRKKLRADPIEKIIAESRVLWPGNDEVVVYRTLVEIKRAIKNGTAPKQLKIYKDLVSLKKLANSDEKVKRLLSYIEPLENWVGRRIGLGKPRYKRFRKQLQREINPLSSWLLPAALKLTEDDEDDEVVSLTVGATAEGTAQVKALLGNKDFPYPKPLSLIMGLLSQATRKNDTVLDFFAGSGTTGHAVLALNASDGGNRKFIACSSTEATRAHPEKNICRDVCAQRIRRVIETDPSIASSEASNFAYLQLDKYDPASVSFEATAEHAAALVAIRESGCVPLKAQTDDLQVIAKGIGYLVLLCPVLKTTTVKKMAALSVNHDSCRLVVYCTRPVAAVDLLAEHGVSCIAYSIADTLAAGQGGDKTNPKLSETNFIEIVSEQEQSA